jgi:hypothetical protein
VYTTTSAKIIFSWAEINYKGDETGSVIRFSPVVNIQNWINIDKTEPFGMFTGLCIRNVGFIYDVPDSTICKKYRTYSLGIPIGLKLGDLNGKFLFVGYELEFPFNYKEKTFEDEEKIDKKVIWFSDRVNTFNHSIMAGIQKPYGATLKFKYFTNFFNKKYKMSDGSKPYANSEYNVFYFSLSFGLLKNTSFYYSDYD